jgi:ferrous iron transport protein B
VASGQIPCQPKRVAEEPPALREALRDLVGRLQRLYPQLPNHRWVAMRLLAGDDRILQAVQSGEIAQLAETSTVGAEPELRRAEPAKA